MISPSNVLTIAKIYSKWLIRRPATYLFITMFMPISIIVPLLFIAPRENWVDVITGALLFSVIGGGIADVTLNVSFDKQTRRLSFFMNRPVKSIEYMLGILLGGGAYTFIGASILLVIGDAILGFILSPIQIFGLFTLIFVAWMSSSNIGFILAQYGPKDFRLAGSLSDFLLYSLAFLAPVYYPIELLPAELQVASNGIYTTHLALIAKSIMRDSPVPWFSLVFIAVLIVILTIISAKAMRWKKA